LAGPQLAVGDQHRSMSLLRRALSIACWLAIAALLVRIAAGGALVGLMDAPSVSGVVIASVGTALAGAAVVLVVGLTVGARWARALSIGAAVVAIAEGMLLAVAEHESGTLIAAAAALALLAGLGERPISRPAD
jgi:hypothetical protein